MPCNLHPLSVAPHSPPGEPGFCCFLRGHGSALEPGKCGRMPSVAPACGAVLVVLAREGRWPFGMPSHRPPSAEHLDGDAVLLLLGHVWTSPWFSGEGLGSGAGPEQRSHEGPAGGSQRMQRPQDTREPQARSRGPPTAGGDQGSESPESPSRQAGGRDGSFRNSCRMLRSPGPV